MLDGHFRELDGALEPLHHIGRILKINRKLFHNFTQI